MRIIGGRFKGMRLASFNASDTSPHLRPTSDRVREALFNILENGRFGNLCKEAHVLDLFAGTGAMGLEALSRGAKSIYFVDNNKASHSILHQNIKKTGSSSETYCLKQDATMLKAIKKHPFSLIFLDPPYHKNLGSVALASALQARLIDKNSYIIWEEGSFMATPPPFILLDHRRYGDTHIHILQYHD